MTQTSGASSSAEKPLFRYDLQTTAIEESGNRFVDVTAPDGGESFRFYEVEYAVACGMDGERDIPALVRWAMLELELQTTPAEVGAIVDKLQELNYIDQDDAVVLAPEVAASSAESEAMELGGSGRSPMEAPRPEMPTESADLELGFAGRGIEPTPAPPVESGFELGVAGNEGSEPVDEVAAAVEEPAAADSSDAVADLVAEAADTVASPSKEVSTDLSNTFRIDPAEVKEAVRASKVMPAVDDPTDSADADATPELVAADADISTQIAEDADEESAAGAIEIKDTPENEAKKAAAEAKATEAARLAAARKPFVQRTAPILLWLILLGTVAGGAYYYYTEFVQEPEPKQSKAEPLPTPVQAPPEPPPLPSSIMQVTDAPVVDALASRAGIVDWVVDPASEVSKGDVILKLKGFQRFENVVERQAESLKTYELRLETAKARNNADRVASLEGNVSRKKEDLSIANNKLDVFVVKAPIDGVVEVLVEKASRVKASQAIAKVTGPASSLAVFTLPEGQSPAADDEIDIEAISDKELKATCKVTKAEGLKVTLDCPVDSGIAAETAIQLSM